MSMSMSQYTLPTTQYTLLSLKTYAYVYIMIKTRVVCCVSVKKEHTLSAPGSAIGGRSRGFVCQLVNMRCQEFIRCSSGIENCPSGAKYRGETPKLPY